ncbi:hypothetical protein [Solibacillus isronensis]
MEHSGRKVESFTKKVEPRFKLEHGGVKVEGFMRKVEHPVRNVEHGK